MALAQHKTVAVRILWILRVNVHFVKIKNCQNIRNRQRTADMAGRRGMYRLKTSESDLCRGDC